MDGHDRNKGQISMHQLQTQLVHFDPLKRGQIGWLYTVITLFMIVSIYVELGVHTLIPF